MRISRVMLFQGGLDEFGRWITNIKDHAPPWRLNASIQNVPVSSLWVLSPLVSYNHIFVHHHLFYPGLLELPKIAKTLRQRDMWRNQQHLACWHQTTIWTRQETHAINVFQWWRTWVPVRTVWTCGRTVDETCMLDKDLFSWPNSSKTTVDI